MYYLFLANYKKSINKFSKTTRYCYMDIIKLNNNNKMRHYDILLQKLYLYFYNPQSILS